MVALRLGLTGPKILLAPLPELDWSLALRIEYLTFFCLFPIFTAMMRSLYPEDIHRSFMHLTIAISGVFTLYVFSVDTLSGSKTIPVYQIILLLQLIYGLYFVARIFLNKREGRYFFGIASLVGMMGVVSEVLFLKGYWDVMKVGSFGIIGFIFVQAISIAARFSKSYYRVEELSGQLEKRNVSLKESEYRYRRIFEDSKDVIFVTDQLGNIQDVSPSSIDLVGYTPKELRDLEDLNLLWDKEDRAHFAQSMQDTDYIEDFEVNLRHKKGHQVRVLINAKSLRRGSDGVVGYQGYARDISDKVQALEQRQRAERLEVIATKDPLTKAFSRRYFYDAVQREMARAKRTGSSLALVMLDIDLFKHINDQYGHLVGDKVLVALADLCQENLRATDIFTRFGGEEFIILMPDTDLETALQKTEVLREMVEHRPLTTVGEDELTITFSAGVAIWVADEDVECLIGGADSALYEAKASGRNCAKIRSQISA